MGCGTPQLIEVEQTMLPSIVEVSQIPLQLTQTANALDFSMTNSLTNSMSQNFKCPIFTTNQRQTNVYAAPQLHAHICEYAFATSKETFFGQEIDALEVQTGTLLKVQKLENFTQLTVNAFINQLILSVNLPEIFTKTLDFQPKKFIQGIESTNYTVANLISSFHSLPVNFVKLTLKNLIYFISQLQEMNVTTNGLSAENISIGRDMRFSLQNLFAASRNFSVSNLPYAGRKDSENIVNLVMLMKFGVSSFFQFKNVESLLIFEGNCAAEDFFVGPIRKFLIDVGQCSGIEELAGNEFLEGVEVEFIRELVDGGMSGEDVDVEGEKESKLLEQLCGEVDEVADFEEGGEEGDGMRRGMSEVYFGNRVCENQIL